MHTSDAPPNVSIVLPFLDPQPFFLEAIASVLAQTHEHWELLLVDDGSSDGSDEVAAAVAALHPERIRCLRHDGGGTRGMSSSRNLGLSEARGAYVAFLDADDVWYPTKLEEQVTLLSAHPEAAMVYGPTEWWYSWTGNPSDRGRDFIQEIGIPLDAVHEPPSLVTALLRREHPTMTPALVRRDSLLQAGGFEDSFAGLYEDQAACVKIAVVQPVLVSSACWYRWRQHHRQSCTVSLATGRYAVARELFLEWLAELLREREVADPELQLALEHARAGEAATAPRPTLRERWYAHGHRLARALRRPSRPISFGDLDRTEPVSRSWGFERGRPVDRFYIEGFLAQHAVDVRGRVLEVGGDDYTQRFGAKRVVSSDVLHIDTSNPKATIVGDLMAAPDLPADQFDCVICTQTLQFIEDPARAVGTLHRILAPGGVLLATFPGISQMGSDEWQGSWCWRFTPRIARVLLVEHFGDSAVQVTSYGNVAAAVAFLHGLAVEDVPLRHLASNDPSYDLLLAVRAVKQA